MNVCLSASVLLIYFFKQKISASVLLIYFVKKNQLACCCKQEHWTFVSY
jgi:hypothetical protein